MARTPLSSHPLISVFCYFCYANWGVGERILFNVTFMFISLKGEIARSGEVIDATSAVLNASTLVVDR